VKHGCSAVLLLSWLVAGCDAVPDLYVVDATVDTSMGTDAGESSDGGDAALDAGDAGDAEQETGPCVGLSCPACAPNPGMCCDSGIPCVGTDCAASCGACSTCAPGQMCCSKQGGPPLCRDIDGGKCP
jgi:hypothetical protein